MVNFNIRNSNFVQSGVRTQYFSENYDLAILGNSTFHNNINIINDSRIGIGTNSPSCTLDINRTDAIKLPSGAGSERGIDNPVAGMIRYNTDEGFGFEGYNGSSWSLLGSGGSGSGGSTNQIQNNSSSILIDSSNNVKININSNEKVRINSSGNVGIGTNDPKCILDIHGDAIKLPTSNSFTGTPTAGMMRYNNGFEGYDGSTWSLIASSNVSTNNISEGNTSVEVDSTNNNIIFKTNNVERFEISSNGHLLPKSNASFDIGSAEYKIRHLFLSDNSMWIGDKCKLSVSESGEFKVIKRNTSQIPSGITTNMPDAFKTSGNIDNQLVITEIKRITNREIDSIDSIRLDDWLKFTKEHKNVYGDDSTIDTLYPVDDVTNFDNTPIIQKTTLSVNPNNNILITGSDGVYKDKELIAGSGISMTSESDKITLSVNTDQLNLSNSSSSSSTNSVQNTYVYYTSPPFICSNLDDGTTYQDMNIAYQNLNTPITQYRIPQGVVITSFTLIQKPSSLGNRNKYFVQIKNNDSEEYKTDTAIDPDSDNFNVNLSTNISYLKDDLLSIHIKNDSNGDDGEVIVILNGYYSGLDDDGANNSITYNVKVSAGKYVLNDIESPVISLLKGFKYIFILDNSLFDSENSSNNHPFYITSSSIGGTHVSNNLYNTGVENNGSTSGNVIFTVPLNAPNNLYYQCGNHINMGAKINIVDNLTILPDDNKIFSINNNLDVTLGENIELNFSNIIGGSNISNLNDNLEINNNNLIYNTNGKLGVGIDSPTEKLHVVGNVKATNFKGNLEGNVSGSSGSCTGNAATATKLETAINIGGVSFDGDNSINLPGVNEQGNQNTSGNIVGNNDFSVNINKLVVKSTGNVGIGITNPSEKLDVDGTVKATNFKGNLEGDVSGNVSGSSGSCTGNAATATKISSINNDNIVQLTVEQTLTQKKLTSPILDGIPIAPTASNSTTNTDQIATTKFVQTRIGEVINSAPTALDTLNELAAALGDDANYAGTVTSNLAGKADINNAVITNTLSVNTDKLVVSSSGKVGIGKIDPQYKLDVSGDVNISSGSLYKINGSQINTDNVLEGTKKYYSSALFNDDLSSTFGKSSGNTLKLEADVALNDILLAGATNIKGITYSYLKSQLSLNNVDNTSDADKHENTVFSGDAITLPFGTTGQQPQTATKGMLRYNTTDNQFEGFTTDSNDENGEWGAIAGGGSDIVAGNNIEITENKDENDKLISKTISTIAQVPVNNKLFWTSPAFVHNSVTATDSTMNLAYSNLSTPIDYYIVPENITVTHIMLLQSEETNSEAKYTIQLFKDDDTDSIKSTIITLNGSDKSILTTLSVSLTENMKLKIKISNSSNSNTDNEEVIVMLKGNYENYGYLSTNINVIDNGNVGIGNSTPSTKLDVSGDVTATKFKGNLEGNADSATNLKTARNISGVSFDGSTDITLNNLNITNGAKYYNSLTGGTNINTSENTINLDNTLSGLTSVTSTNFIGNLQGNVTGNADTASKAKDDSELKLSIDSKSSKLNPVFTGTESITLPIGTSEQRPEQTTKGMLRYNTTHNKFEGYNGTTWGDITEQNAHLSIINPFKFKKLGSDINSETAVDFNGFNVSLNADGTILATGATDNDGINGSDSGHVRVYQWREFTQNDNDNNIYHYTSLTQDTTTQTKPLIITSTAPVVGTYYWTQLGTDIDGEAAWDYSGWSISLSADGTIIAISAADNDGSNGEDSGHVRVYQYNGSSWIQLGTDIDGENANDYSGTSVSLSADGTIVAIGAYVNDGNGTDSGHVRVYEYNGSSWNQLGSDIDGEAANDKSGFSVSLSANGTIVAIGASDNDGNGTDSGHVRVYEYNGSSWNQLGSDIDGETAGDDSSGRNISLSLSADGSIVAIGARYNNNDDRRSNVRIYQYNGTTWTQLGSDIDGEIDNYVRTESFLSSEISVSLSADGTILAIGNGNNDNNGTNSGHVRIYQYNGIDAWTQVGSDIDGETAGDKSGYSVSLSADGTSVAIGSYGNSEDSGLVRVYKIFDPKYSLQVNGNVQSTNFIGNLQGDVTGSNDFSVNTDKLVVKSDGNVGIGTTSPSYPLHIKHITGVNDNMNSDKHNFLRNGNEFHNDGGALGANQFTVSLYSENGSIITNKGFVSISDSRIKTNIEELVDNEALLKFRQLKPCKYNYIDVVQKGNDTVYGFIAQEVKEVMPYAANILPSIEYIPNIYKGGIYNNNVITFDTANNLDSDGNIKLILPSNKEITVPYTIVDTLKINIDISELSDDEKPSNDLVQDENGNDLPYNIFVYGTNVDDFHTLNKDAIWTTAAAALQEVDRIQQADAVKIQTLETKNSELETKVSTLETQLADVLTRLAALENN